MNKTVNMNLGGIPFQIDDIAYDKLQAYINAVRTKFQNVEGHQDIIDDIEARLGEMFHESLDKEKRSIVSINDVDGAIKIMGKPEEFGFDDEESTTSSGASTSSKTRTVGKKLFRDPDDAWLGGVLSGLSKYAGVENSTWFRVLFLVLLTDILWIGIPISSTTLVLIYVILWIAVPKALTSNDKMRMHGEEVTLDSIERKATEFRKKVTSNTPKSTVSDGLSAVLGGIVKIIALVFLGFGILIGGVILISFLAAMVSVLGFGISASPFLTDHIFGSSAATWGVILGLVLTTAAPLVFFITLFIKLVFKTKTNMPIIAVGSLGALIVGILMSSFPIGKVINDTKRGATAEQTTAIALANDNLILSATSELDEYTFDNDGVVSFSFDEFEFDDPAEVEIVKAKDSIVSVTTRLRARGKTRDVAKERVEAMNYEIEVIDSANLRIQDTYVYGDKELKRGQDVEVSIAIPVGTSFEVDESAYDLIRKVDKADGYNRMTIAKGKWKMTEDGLVKLGQDGEPLPIDTGKNDSDDDDDDDGDVWDDWDDDWGSSNLDVDESVEVSVFGKKILDVQVTERDEDGEAERVKIKLKNGEILDVDIQEKGKKVTIESEEDN